MTENSTAVKITTSDKTNRIEYQSKAADALAQTFRTDPGTRFISSHMSVEGHNAYLQTWMRVLTKAAMLNGGIFQEANGWQSLAVWLPPEAHIDNLATVVQAGFLSAFFKLGYSGVKRLLVDVMSQTDKAKKEYLAGSERYYYLFFIGTHAEARGKSLASTLIRNFQAIAEAEGLPIWLEASTEHSRNVYMKCGFQQVDEIVFGKETHASNGEFEKGGPGVKIYPMLWKPSGPK